MPTNNLSWTPAGGGVTSQNIKRGTEPNPTTVIANVSATTSTYSDTTAVAKNDYYYVVESVCPNGNEAGNEATVCNDGDVSAAVSLGGITYDDSNAPYSGFIVDHYTGNVYGGNSGSTQTAHHLVGHNPGITSWPSQITFSSSYDSNTSPYGYCDGIFGAYNVDKLILPGFYNNSVFFYIGLNVERSTDNGVTKEFVGSIDPETDSYFVTVVDNSVSSPTAAPRVHTATTRSDINIASSTVDFRPTGNDSIYYTLSVSSPTNIAPVTFLTTHEYNDETPTPSFLTLSRFRVNYGVIENNSDVHIGGCQNLTGGAISGTPGTLVGTGSAGNPAIRNTAFDASNDVYIDVEAFEPYSSGTAGTTKVIVRYKVNGGALQTLGTVYSPPYTGVQSSNNSQRFTLSRTNYQKVEFDILVTGATDTEAAANSGGGA